MTRGRLRTTSVTLIRVNKANLLLTTIAGVHILDRLVVFVPGNKEGIPLVWTSALK